jgi:hypothetical protein
MKCYITIMKVTLVIVQLARNILNKKRNGGSNAV